MNLLKLVNTANYFLDRAKKAKEESDIETDHDAKVLLLGQAMAYSHASHVIINMVKKIQGVEDETKIAG